MGTRTGPRRSDRRGARAHPRGEAAQRDRRDALCRDGRRGGCGARCLDFRTARRGGSVPGIHADLAAHAGAGGSGTVAPVRAAPDRAGCRTCRIRARGQIRGGGHPDRSPCQGRGDGSLPAAPGTGAIDPGTPDRAAGRGVGGRSVRPASDCHRTRREPRRPGTRSSARAGAPGVGPRFCARWDTR